MVTRRLHTDVQMGLQVNSKVPNTPFRTSRAESCTCWEKVDSVPCEKKSCPKVKGLKGRCGVEQPAKDFVKTEYRCEDK